MSLIKVLYISAFIFLKPSVEGDSGFLDPCDKFTLKSKITFTDGKGASVEIEASGGETPYKYIFYKESGHLVSTKFDNNWVEGLPKGKYACTVADKNNCKKTIDIEIK